MKIRHALLTAASRLQRAQLWIAAAALVTLMAITVVDVSLRYFNRPVRGSYDMVEVALLFFVFNGMAAAFFSRRNIVIDLLDSFVGKHMTTVLVRVADFLSVVCLVLLFWAMLLPARQTFEYGEVKIELNLPVYIMWIIALVSLVGTIFCAVVTLLARPVSADIGHSE